MLIIKPSLNKPIKITDTLSGSEWNLYFFYQAGGKVALAFDAPQSIRIENTAKTAKERKSLEDGNEINTPTG